MDFSNGLGDRAIKDVVQDHPRIGAILQKYEIGCVSCGVGICHLKDVVSIHGLSEDVDARIQQEIEECLKGL